MLRGLRNIFCGGRFDVFPVQIVQNRVFVFSPRRSLLPFCFLPPIQASHCSGCCYCYSCWQSTRMHTAEQYTCQRYSLSLPSENFSLYNSSVCTFLLIFYPLVQSALLLRALHSPPLHPFHLPSQRSVRSHVSASRY